MAARAFCSSGSCGKSLRCQNGPMWMMELAIKTNTAPNRIGSHSRESSVMTVSLNLFWLSEDPGRRAFCSGGRRGTDRADHCRRPPTPGNYRHPAARPGRKDFAGFCRKWRRAGDGAAIEAQRSATVVYGHTCRLWHTCRREPNSHAGRCGPELPSCWPTAALPARSPLTRIRQEIVDRQPSLIDATVARIAASSAPGRPGVFPRLRGLWR